MNYLPNNTLNTDRPKATFGTAGVAKRLASGGSVLHEIASEALQAFAGIPGSVLGLGSFDPPADFGFEAFAHA